MAGETSETLRGISNRILVIDDEPLIRWALSVGLSAAGYDAVAAADSVEALRLVHMWPHPDVVLLDLHHQDCSMVLAELRATLPHCHVLVLGTCCDGGSGPRWQGLEIVPKPFDLPDIVDRVKRALAETHVTS